MGESFVDCRTNKNRHPAADRSRRTGCSLLRQPSRGTESQTLPRKQVCDLCVARWPKPYVRNLRAEHDGHVPLRADAIVYRVGDDTGSCALEVCQSLGEHMSVPSRSRRFDRPRRLQSTHILRIGSHVSKAPGADIPGKSVLIQADLRLVKLQTIRGGGANCCRICLSPTGPAGRVHCAFTLKNADYLDYGLGIFSCASVGGLPPLRSRLFRLPQSQFLLTRPSGMDLRSTCSHR